ncbi:major facilitator superfamily [Heterobasidion irregulare TC 32-1]|uniref:Major facilitator superfamily n=1 Tax=Heterobasidion irregulare (strain TC 32-1) TaxID=747525 RepID=W4JN05_HETIT|nr:major facilitator superfamily [Heterobasidion irregulare TC 32-1]ETW74942.1 major facilitator superfamily [Heterobasidion irregulare TC 32-1]
MALDDVQPFDNAENGASFGPREQKASRTLRKDDDNDALSGIQRNYTEKKLLRRLDMRLMPAMVVIFLMNTIDRTGITAARLKGLEQDLGLTDIQYNIVLAVLYASYCPAQVPSNMFTRSFRPSIYIGMCVIAWGLTSTLTGVTHNFSGILACRVFIGLPEAAFYPGATYLLSRWYTRKELCLRAAILACGILLSSAFGSLMAAGVLSGMEGCLGIRAWRWFVLSHPNSRWGRSIHLSYDHQAPNNTRWLSPAERRLAQVRLSEDAGEADEDSADDSAWSGLVSAISDPKVPIMAVMACSQLLGLSFINFFPTLTSTLGFNPIISLLLAAPPWIFATIVCCVNAWHADRTGERFFHIAGWWWGVIIAYIIALNTMSIGGRYVALFIMAAGNSGYALTLVWVSNAIPRPPAKRSAAISIVSSIGNVGNLYVLFSENSASFSQKKIGSGRLHGRQNGALSTIRRCL